jgi:hypothetical protein
VAVAATAPGVEDIFFEDFQSIGPEVYEEVTGEEIPERRGTLLEEPAGQSWTDDELPGRFPRVWARFRSP